MNALAYTREQVYEVQPEALAGIFEDDKSTGKGAKK